jgi:nicotinamidase-related amidase
MMAWARSKNIPIISTCEVYPNNNHEEAKKPCVFGTEGQKKIHYTIVSNSVSFTADGNTDLPRDMLRQYQQVILHKRCVDPFDEPRIDRLLSELRVGEFILIGASAEGAVMATALGLLQRGKNVTVVVDAVGTRDSKEAQMALRKMQAKGARLIQTQTLAGITKLRQVGVCHCPSCKGQSIVHPQGTAKNKLPKTFTSASPPVSSHPAASTYVEGRRGRRGHELGGGGNVIVPDKN